jgi:hypothetical protein
MFPRLAHTPQRVFLLLLVWLLLGSTVLHAQTYDYGNAWYNPNADYLRFKVAEDGIYRVSAQQLMQAGFDTTGIDPSNLHLLYRGVEQFIHIEPAQNGNWEYPGIFWTQKRWWLGYATLRGYLHTPGRCYPSPQSTCFYVFGYFGLLFPCRQPAWIAVAGAIFGFGATTFGDRGDRQNKYPGVPSWEWGHFSRGWRQCTYDIFHALNPEWTQGKAMSGSPFLRPTTSCLPISDAACLEQCPRQTFSENGKPATVATGL